MFLSKRKFTAESTFQDAEKHSGFLNEAKEWAGELLSGQTKVNKWFESKIKLHAIYKIFRTTSKYFSTLYVSMGNASIYLK